MKVFNSIDIGDNKKKIEFSFPTQAKKDVIETLQHKFDQIWQENDLSLAMINLEYSKSESKGDEKKWRPMGKTPEEQIRPNVCKKLLEIKKILKKQVNSQQNHIEMLFRQVDGNRKSLRAQRDEMDGLMIAMDHSKMGLEKANADVTEFCNATERI